MAVIVGQPVQRGRTSTFDLFRADIIPQSAPQRLHSTNAADSFPHSAQLQFRGTDVMDDEMDDELQWRGTDEVAHEVDDGLDAAGDVKMEDPDDVRCSRLPQIPPELKVQIQALEQKIGISLCTNPVAAVAALSQGRDVLTKRATNAGKSLTFQIFAMVHVCNVLVITPNIAIMDTQQWECKRLGLGATALHSGIPVPESTPGAHLLYMCPQRLLGQQCTTDSATFQHVLQNPPHLIVVDEAHLVATSDSEFAPQWLALGALREKLPQVPMLCCTATCTAEDEVKIRDRLRMHDPLVLTTALQRKGTHIHVHDMEGSVDSDSTFQYVHQLAKERCGLVYAGSIDRVKRYVRLFTEKGMRVAEYTSQTGNDRRQLVLQQLSTGM